MGHIQFAGQTISFLLSIAIGGIFCIIYDLIRIAHKTVCKKWLEIFFLDILYWVVITFLTYLFLLARCKGEVRGYVLTGEIIGFIMIRYTISDLFLKLSLKILMGLKSIIGFILCPMRLFFSKIRRFMISFKVFLENIAQQIKKLLKRVKAMMYNHSSYNKPSER